VTPYAWHTVIAPHIVKNETQKILISSIIKSETVIIHTDIKCDALFIEVHKNLSGQPPSC